MDASFLLLSLVDVLNKDLDYDHLSRHIPEGWDTDMVSSALDKGFLLFGLNMLQPSPRHWTVEILLSNLNTYDPTLLDPFSVPKLLACTQMTKMKGWLVSSPLLI